MKVLVLCSGGLDSTVLLHRAVKMHGSANVIALNMYYGQRHAKEAAYAKFHCDKLSVRMYEVDMSSVFRFNPNCCSLLKDSSLELDHRSYEEQVGELKDKESISAYVPYRNGLFLSYAAAVALQLGCSEVHYGAHADDAAGHAYPDCTPEFIQHQMRAIVAGTNGAITMVAPLWNLNKAGVVAMGLSHGMTHNELRNTWSCYEGNEEPCGTCGTCIDRRRAFEANNIFDIM